MAELEEKFDLNFKNQSNLSFLAISVKNQRLENKKKGAAQIA